MQCKMDHKPALVCTNSPFEELFSIVNLVILKVCRSLYYYFPSYNHRLFSISSQSACAGTHSPSHRSVPKIQMQPIVFDRKPSAHCAKETCQYKLLGGKVQGDYRIYLDGGTSECNFPGYPAYFFMPR